MSTRQDRKALYRAAKKLRDELESRCSANGFLSRQRLRIVKSYTDGWYILVGHTNDRKLGLQLWLDRYPATKERRFYFGFHSFRWSRIVRLQNCLPSHLQPIRTLTSKHFTKMGPMSWLLHPGLKPHEYARPILENYWGKYCFYGMYDREKSRTHADVARTVSKAAAFFSQALWALSPPSRPAALVGEVYPQLEREVVRKHMVRERSGKLALACKQRDGFRCQVCGMTFEEVYGELGYQYAQSHHLNPLSRTRANVKTRLEDLTTVCANCHCMLHLMRGREHDLVRLRSIVETQRKQSRRITKRS